MQLETINKLYLELSQVATARTATEVKLMLMIQEANEVLRSVWQIAERNGEADWQNFRVRLSKILDEQHRLMYPGNYSDNGQR
jgi:hypothetical protein